VLLVAFVFTGCKAAREQSLSAAYTTTQQLLRSEQTAAAAQKLEQVLQRITPESRWYWRFRLLRVEILLARRESRHAQAALNFQVPPGPQWTQERARQLLYEGHAAHLLYKYDLARQYLQQAELVARSIAEAGLIAEIELRQGLLAVETRDFDAGRAKFRDVLEYATQNHDQYLEMLASGSTGYLYLQSFHFDMAIPWFERALVLARHLNAPMTESRTVGNLGSCYYRLGEWDKAARYFDQAEVAFASAGQPQSRQIWLGNLGNVYLDRHDYARAGDFYQKALAIARDLGDERWMATWLNNLALTSIEAGELDMAERYNNEARVLKKKLNNSAAEIYSVTNAARIAAGRNDLTGARSLFESVIRSESEDPTPLLEAHVGLARLRQKANDPLVTNEFRAVDQFIARQSSKLIKDEYKLSYFSRLIDFYREYVDFLMARGKSEAALQVAESSRARVLSGRLRIGRLRELEETTDFQTLARAHRCVFLSYWLAPKVSYLWVVTASHTSSFRLPPEAEIRELVEQYDALIQNLRDPLKVDAPAGRKLYETLIAPASQLLENAKHVILAVDGPLFSLNFETIPVAVPKPHYWIEDVVLSLTPSLGLLRVDRGATDSGPRSLLLVGNPVSSSEQYPPLQFAGQEIAEIDKGLPGFQKVILSGPEAHADAYSQSDAGRFTFIHFVAHAVANSQDPLNSAVILSPRGSRDRLFAKDILNTRLQAQLVTISACRSAAGKIYAGEGLVGFSWAFLRAGARNVIAGLWDVTDRSTARMMANLYSELARHVPPTEALRMAKLDLMQSSPTYQKPYYWGPFLIYIR
jgi:CHAT domain-containing protein